MLDTNQQHPHDPLARDLLDQSTSMNPESLLPKRDNQSIYEKIPGGKGLKDNMLDTNQQHPHDPLARDLLDQSTSLNPESLLPKRDNQRINEKIPGGKGLEDNMLNTNQQHPHDP
jgi:hypothetical protein